MKKFKRLIALVLAGVLCLAVLTACGGSNGAPGSTELENKLMQYVNKGANTSYSNDAQLQSKIRAVLAKVDENGCIKAQDMPTINLKDVDPTVEEDLPVAQVSDAKYDPATGKIDSIIYMLGSETATGDFEAMEIAEEMQLKLDDQINKVRPGSLSLNGAFGKGSTVQAVGIATWVTGGKTYYGIAFHVIGNMS